MTTVDPDKGTFDENGEPLSTLTRLVFDIVTLSLFETFLKYRIITIVVHNTLYLYLSSFAPCRMVRSYGNEAVDKLVGNQAVIGLQLGLLDGAGEKVRVGDPVYAAVL